MSFFGQAGRPGQPQVMVMKTQNKREHGRKTQMVNIQAAKAVADVIRTTLGPKSMLKMILDMGGGILLTNDGNAILREIDVSHPAAKSMIQLSRAQDEEVGDGTTSVIILAGEMLTSAVPLIERSIHPSQITHGYFAALEEAKKVLANMATTVDNDDVTQIARVVRSCLGTKFSSRFGDLVVDLAVQSVRMISTSEGGLKESDIKRFARIERIPGGSMEDSKVLDGIMINKDITHPRMRRTIENPRIVLLDCPLEYKKGESQTDVELTAEEHFEALLKLEEKEIREMCDHILRLKPDVVVTEKGLSDLAQHFLVSNGVTALRRLKKTDNMRIARAVGATIVHRPDELREEHIGTKCKKFDIRKIGDEYFTFFEECEDPKACTILLRGASTDVLREIERNLQDAMFVARNVVYDPRLLPGGGACEMTVSQALNERAQHMKGSAQYAFRAVAEALEVIPRTLCQNCGADTIRIMTALRAKHANGENVTWGINGESGEIADMAEVSVWEPFLVKEQTFKTAIESACMILRIDDIVSGVSNPEAQEQQARQQAPPPEE